MTLDNYDLNIAFWQRLSALSYNGMTTLRPDEIFDPKDLTSSATVRRGFIIGPDPQVVGFGHGVCTRHFGIYQIDIWVPRATTSALKTLAEMADAHIAHFYPDNGRGLTLTENSTLAHIERHPSVADMAREGAYLRRTVSVDFYVDDFPSA